MGNPEVEIEEPLSPLGRLFLTPEMHQIVHCIMGCENPIDVAAVTSEISNSVMVRLPRFSSLLVRDSHGREHWRKTQVDVRRHVVVVEEPVSDAGDDGEAVNDYVADLAVSLPLSSDKPLILIKALKTHNHYLSNSNLVQMQTINDVLFGVISSGLSRYLDLRSPKGKL
ncbi:hypothetical protein C3L33_20922, partial [Rhododendron williamsianum]